MSGVFGGINEGVDKYAEIRYAQASKQGITAPFFRIKQHIFVMDNRLT